MIEVKAKDLVNHIGKHFEYEDFILGTKVFDSGTIVSLEPIEDSFGLGDYVLEYEDEDGDNADFLVHGHKIFQITE